MKKQPFQQRFEASCAQGCSAGKSDVALGTGQGNRLALQRLFVFLAAACTLICASKIRADQTEWFPLGPQRGALYPMAIDTHDPSILYSTNWHDIYKTIDKGKNWRLVRQGSPDTSVTMMAIDPTNSLMLFLGTSIDGLYKSTDGGETWGPASEDFPTGQTGIKNTVKCLAIDPGNPSTIYMGTGQGLFKSEDTGTTWAPVNNGLRLQYSETLEIHSLAIDPNNPSTLYLGTEYNGIYKSIDAAGSWAPMNQGLGNLYIEDLVVDPINPDVLYVGTSFAGAFKSTDGAKSWTPINSGLPTSPYENWIAVDKIVINPMNTTIIYAEISLFEGPYGESGLYRSDNGGLSWKQIVGGLGGISIGSLGLGPFLIDPQSPAALYLGTTEGIYITSDAGTNWAPTKSPTSLSVSALAIDPPSSLNLYAGLFDGNVFESDDQGAHWVQRQAGPSRFPVNTLVISPDNPLVIYASTAGGLYKSTDAGENWTLMPIGPLEAENIGIGSLVLDPSDSSKIFAVTNYGVFKSIDSGGNWRQLDEGMYPGSHIYSLAIDLETPSTIFAGGMYDAAPGGPHGTYFQAPIFYKSIDGGDHWTPVFVGSIDYDAPWPSGGSFLTLVLANSTTMYAVGGGVFRSTDGGQSWDEINSMLVDEKIAVDPQNPDTIYLGNAKEFFKSVDRGQTWQSMPSIPGIAELMALVVDPNNSSRIYAGTDAGVFYMQDVACNYSISNMSKTYPSSGIVLDHVDLICPGSCRWTAASNAAWLTIISASSGWGNVTVSFTVGANTTSSRRTGTITIAGQSFTVTQDGLATAFLLNGVTPVSGPIAGGTIVTLNGGGFQVGASVRVGGIPSRIISLNSSQIVIETGASSSTGPSDVSVANPGGDSVVLKNGFTYTASTDLFSQEVFVPIVLSSGGMNNSYFTSELTLINRGTGNATLHFTYTTAFGMGSGTASDTLPAGQQRIVPDAVSYLRSLWVPIPASGSQGGTLRVNFAGLTSPTDAEVMVRTTTNVPEGRAGLAYAGIPASMALTDPCYIVGLRQNQIDRSNVAVQHAGSAADGALALRLTVFSGNGGVGFSQILPEVVLTPGGFSQISGIIHSNGLSLENGYVKIERISGTAPYYAYGVINDQANSDGSFIPPVLETALSGKTRMTLPAVVESGPFSTELIVTNWSASKKSLSCRYVANAIQSDEGAAPFSIELAPGEQLIWPDLIGRLRAESVAGIGPKGSPFAGALVVAGSGSDLSGIMMAARTSAPGGGGEYGVFYPAVAEGGSTTQDTWLFGLQQNEANRTNLALVNTAEADNNPDTFSIELFDGLSGQKVQTIEGIVLDANHWYQFNSILAQYAPSTRQGYAHVTRTGGANPFIAYAVINDGGIPGQRSGDGAFISSLP
jgi:photosystem II stability/assembly factor-like uncharacterized protein